VFKQAFTRYGATGLSEPSIWVGGLLVHKQYVMPFAPMNALHKLVAADGYQRFISRDSILRTLMPTDDMDVELDAGVQNMDYDLCRSLTELRTKVRGRSHTDRPMFAYTQPQNIHISRITRERASVPAGAAYPGFYPPYAARIQRMDGCFGEFVQFLRDEGLYDDSVIVLTSDHGDSLGEGGRWGHAYTIFPEVIRIPLVVHLPRVLQESMTCDTDAVASLVDITPSLYYLLGHRPVVSGSIFGRPLCTETLSERTATRRDWYMVVSSYGPVYGILRGNGRSLYIADGVNYTDYYYDLMEDPAGSRNRVTPAVRREYQDLIREGIDDVNRFYRADAPGAHTR
jgi:arylsulfatase A-like enzyme